MNESEFLKTLSETPWDSAFVFEDVDDIVDAWYCFFYEAVNIHMPLKKKRVKYDTQPKWLTSELLELIKSRDQKLKKAKYSQWRRQGGQMPPQNYFLPPHFAPPVLDNLCRNH